MADPPAIDPVDILFTAIVFGVKLFIIIFPVEIVLIPTVLKFALGAVINCAPIVLVVRLQDVTLLTKAAEDPDGNPNVFNTLYPPSNAVLNVTKPKG